MILAAAIKITNKNSNDSIILCGANHGEIYKQMDFFKININDIIEEEGFIDHKHNFLDRQSAFKHAADCGQIASRLISNRINCDAKNPNLISEDLW